MTQTTQLTELSREEVDEPLDGLEVHFIDTDSSEDILIRTADTTIPMSTNDYIIADNPVPYLESQLVDEIDLLITTLVHVAILAVSVFMYMGMYMTFF